MATRGVDIGADWTEVTAPLNMADGSEYAVEIEGPSSAIVKAHDSESAQAPAADADGHSLYPRSQRPEGDLLRFEKRPGWYWWLRTDGGNCRLIITETG